MMACKGRSAKGRRRMHVRCWLTGFPEANPWQLAAAPPGTCRGGVLRSVNRLSGPRLLIQKVCRGASHKQP
jgi:hypothetical protein